MHVIYSPKGRAGEYGKLACNIYLSCEHKCLYCYCPQALHIAREEFIKTPVPRLSFLKNLKADAMALNKKGIKENILLSFIGDPYQPIDTEYQLTRQAILILHDLNFYVTILTKGGQRAVQDFDLLRPGDEFATTLTFLDEKKSLQWESGAAIPEERIEVLRKAHDLSIRTWVSLEPVIEPEETLEIIRQTHTFVDLFKVGTLNGHPHARTIDWTKFANDVTTLLEELDCRFYIKKDLLRYL